jgi:dTDP-4-amino-4,6-dideoxygalactose transaminase
VANATLSWRELVHALARPLGVEEAERRIAGQVKGGHPVLFASARGALAAAVRALAQGGRVAVPAYTCIAVPNAVRSGGAHPLFADVDALGLVPPDGWPACDAVIIQDSYGFDAEGLADRIVIRDAAHRPRLDPGKHDAVVVSSFEHSKWLCAGQGGLAVTRDAALATQLRALRDGHSVQHSRLTHGFVTLLTLAAGRLQYGGHGRLARPLRRVAIRLAPERMAGQCFSELAGEGVDPALLGRPNGTVARLIISQLARRERVSAHRARIVALYDIEAGVRRPPLPLLRYPLRVDRPERFERELRQHGWDLSGRWFRSPLHPGEEIPPAYGFDPHRAPEAVRLAGSVVNLPTHPLVDERDARTLVRLALDAGARVLG